jgi:hypothetical protein
LFGLWKKTLKLVLLFWLLLVGPALSIPLFAFPYTRRNRRMYYPLLIGAFFMLALWVETYMQAHYFAPAVALIFVVVLQCMRHLARWRGFVLGPAFVRIVPLIYCAMLLLRLMAIPARMFGETWPRGNLDRARVLRALEASPGEHLVIVQYVRDHDPNNEWVYNSADIDKSKVVWARDMGETKNQELRRYFSGRRVWLLHPDESPRLLEEMTPTPNDSRSPQR